MIQEYDYDIGIDKITEVRDKHKLNDIQVSVREWDPSAWRVSPPREIFVPKGTTFLEMAQKLNKEVYHDIQPADMSIFKILNEINIYMDDLHKCKVSSLF